MEIWARILLLLAIFIVILISNLLFNYKILVLSKQKFWKAAWFGGLATFFFAFFMGIIALGSLTGEPLWFTILELLILAVSSYFGAILIPIIDKKIAKRNNKKLQKETIKK